uniref:Uncharacterized protein n=1 Tax=Glossina pallidipes TaxID=7398 RepID=A0A1A9ZV23_GLOPL
MLKTPLKNSLILPLLDNDLSQRTARTSSPISFASLRTFSTSPGSPLWLVIGVALNKMLYGINKLQAANISTDMYSATCSLGDRPQPRILSSARLNTSELSSTSEVPFKANVQSDFSVCVSLISFPIVLWMEEAYSIF